MARDRGHVNRMLMGLRVHSQAPLPRGTKLTRDGKEVGEVTSSVVSPGFGTIALAYIRRGNQEPGTVVEYAIGGTAGTGEVVSLPFAA
jgi:glycine cleavage system aminomethyltransferase T